LPLISFLKKEIQHEVCLLARVLSNGHRLIEFLELGIQEDFANLADLAFARELMSRQEYVCNEVISAYFSALTSLRSNDRYGAALALHLHVERLDHIHPQETLPDEKTLLDGAKKSAKMILLKLDTA
jgi:hypothetical protein